VEDVLSDSERDAKVVKDGCLEIRVGPSAETCLIQIVGELDLANVSSLEKELRIAERMEPRSLVLDLSALEFIDSSGIKALMDAQRRSQGNGNALGVIRGPENVQRLLEFCGLTEHLSFLDGAEATSRSASSSPTA
jgi:anti-sigma B factor antagonist